MKLLNKSPIILFVYFTNNNILCTISSIQGQTLMWSTVGLNKLKGTKKITTSTVSVLTKYLYNFSKNKDLLTLHVKIKGTNKIKSNFIKHLKLLGFNILTIQEKFCLPYGGCKNAKVRKF